METREAAEHVVERSGQAPMMNAIVQRPDATQEGEQARAPDRPRIERAAPVLRPLLAWLEARTPTERLTAVLLGQLIQHDAALSNAGLFDGFLGNECAQEWEAEIHEGLLPGTVTDDDAVRFAAALVYFDD